jgi:hypothetical protein
MLPNCASYGIYRKCYQLARADAVQRKTHVVKKETPKPKPTAKIKKSKEETPKQICKKNVSQCLLGVSELEWKCSYRIWNHERHFNPKARNHKSGAYGTAQFMPDDGGAEE